MQKSNRRTLLFLWCALITVLSAGALYATNYVWEGENVSKLTGTAFKVKTLLKDPSGKVSEQKVLGIEKVRQGEKTPTGTAEYKVKLPKAGTYYLWARVRWHCGSRGGYFLLSIEGMKKQLFLGGDGTYDSLHWIRRSLDFGKPLKLNLKKGVTTFTLKSKGSGDMVDQFMLTTDPTMVPAGIYKPTPKLIKKQ